MARPSPRNHCNQTRPKRVSEPDAHDSPTERRTAAVREPAATRTNAAKSRSVFSHGASASTRRSKDAESTALRESLAYSDHRKIAESAPRRTIGWAGHRAGTTTSARGRSKSRATRRTASGGQIAAPAPVAHVALHGARRDIPNQVDREFG